MADLSGDYPSYIISSYSTGAVTGTGSNVGGLVGCNYNSSSITGDYWNIDTSGQRTSAGGTGLTTAQMMQASNFTGWPIADTGGSNAVWRIYDGYTYPLPRAFFAPATVTANNDSKTYDGLAYSGGNGVTYSTGAWDPKYMGTLTYGGTSQGAINAGTYSITPTGYYSGQQGYDISFVEGALTINPASLDRYLWEPDGKRIQGV